MPKTINPTDRRVKIIRVMVNAAELKAFKKAQKQANFKSLADYIRTTCLKPNNA